MSIESKKLDCEFHFPDGTRHEAQAHLFTHEYKGKVFWHGAAHFTVSPTSFPEGIVGGRCTFEDGRTGAVTFPAGDWKGDGYTEVGFIGITYLE